jgi:hypothetical protein
MSQELKLLAHGARRHLSSGAFLFLSKPGFGQVIMHWLSFDCQAKQRNCGQIFL